MVGQSLSAGKTYRAKQVGWSERNPKLGFCDLISLAKRRLNMKTAGRDRLKDRTPVQERGSLGGEDIDESAIQDYQCWSFG